MKKLIGYFLSFLLAMSIGMAAMYYYMEKNPNTITETKLEKSVTVNDNGISDGIDNIYDSVVVVENYNKSKLTGIGSGFIYDENGYIITNHHVVAGATELKAILMSGETVEAQLIGSDEYADIAVIQIDKTHIKAVAKLSSSDKTNLGDTVFTIGSPISQEYYGTVTRGILSGKNRMVEVSVSSNTSDWIMNVMQTDAAINPGNSGGPLCNVSGEVIGVNSMKLVEDSIEGIGFAIPIEDAMLYANKIVNKEEIKRAFLGISMSDLSISTYSLKKENITLDKSITSGVIVLSVLEKGPCEQAGLLKGDVIVRLGENKVKNIAELRYYLYKHEPGETVEIEYIRGKEIQKTKVTLGKSE